MELIRNCSHGSEFCTYMDIENNKVIKAAYTYLGINSLKKEYNGFNWYQLLIGLKNNICNIVLEKEQYIRISTELFPLKKNDYNYGLEYNAQLVERVIKHYCKIWNKHRSKNKVPLHGDLSIDNILYDANNIIIIDWEHFKLDAVPRGFDGLYFLFETLWFGMQKRNNFNISDNELTILKRNIIELKTNNQFDEIFNENILKNIKEFMLNNLDLWDIGNNKPVVKFPVLFFTEQQINNIDGKLNSII